MSAGTFKYRIVGKAPKFQFEGARSRSRSKRKFKSKQELKNHVTGICRDLNFGSKEVK